MKKIIILGITLFFAVSCSVPPSKDAYLESFDKFVSNVKKNSEKFNEKDWLWANKRFSSFCVGWYRKFEEELTLKEKLKVGFLKNQYLTCKEKSRKGRDITGNLDGEITRLGDDLKKYLRENLDSDLKELSKGAREIGDSALKVLDDLLREVKKEKE